MSENPETDTPVVAIPGAQPAPAPTSPAKWPAAAWITLAAMAVQALGYVELFAPGSAAEKILRAVGMVLTAFGAPLLARGGAKLLPIAMVVLALVGCTESAFKQSTVHGAKAFVDCMAPTVKPLAAELVPAFRDIVENALLPDGKIDEEPLRKAAETLKTDAPRCAMSAAVAELLRAATKAGAPMSAPVEVDKAQLGQAYESIRAGWGGATFKLEGGEL